MKMIQKLVLISLSLFGLSVTADVRLPHGEFYLSMNDMSVKVLGGYVTAQRTWYRGAWTFNRAWEPLKLEQDTHTGEVKAIVRNDDRYEQESSGSSNYRFGRRYGILKSAEGYRWQDRRGNWITYDTNGRIQAYGDHNNIQVSIEFDAEGKRSAVLDHLGNTIFTYEYNTEGQLHFVRDKDGTFVEYRYTDGKITEVIDVLGNNWLYGYTNNRMTSRTDAENRTNIINYNPTGRIISEKDAEGIGSTYTYDYDKTKGHYYIRQIDPDGKLTERWYDRMSQLLRIAVNHIDTFALEEDTQLRLRTSTDRQGLKTIREYDLFDNLKQITYAAGSSVSYEYDVITSKITQKVDENQNITQYDYNTQGNLTKLTEAKGSDVERVTEYDYDTYGRLIEVKRLGDAQTVTATSSYGYDDWGNLTSVTDPENKVTQYSHDTRGRVLTRTDANLHTSSADYDLAGRKTKSRSALNFTTVIEYDKVGNVVKVTDPKLNTTTYGYDVRNLRISSTDAYNQTIRMEYIYTGGLSLVDAPLGNAKNLGVDTAFSYNAGGRLKATIDPLNNRQTRTRDHEGRIVSQTDAAGNTTSMGYGDSASQGGGENGSTQYRGLLNRTQYPTFLETYDYDKRNRKTKTIKHLGTHKEISTTEYDFVGNRIKTIDAEERVTRYRYDALNRLIDTIDNKGQSTRYQYDNRDNLISITDPNEHTTRYSYNRRDQKTKETRPGNQEITYYYDDKGNLRETFDPDGRKSIQSYDDADRLTEQKHYGIAQTIPERTVIYDYDHNDNLESYSDGNLSASYQYDKKNRKKTETTHYGDFNLSHSYTYDTVGNKTSYTAPDSKVTHYYWEKNRLQRIAIPELGSLNYVAYQWSRPTKLTYYGGMTREISYDPLMRPTRILAKDPAQSTLLDYQYSFDKTSNITERATHTGTYNYQYDELQRLTEAKNPIETEGWAYDPNGNRTQDNLTPGSWSYDDNDRLQTSPSVSYDYDDAGHPVQKTEGLDVIKSIYNAEGRLARVETAEGTLIGEYEYDPMGRRIKKTTPMETRYFHYSDEGLVGEYTPSATAIQQYGYEPNSTWTTNPVYTKTNEGYAFYQNDHLGTPQQLVKSNGAKVWEGEYRAFGEVTETNQSWNNPLRFPGQYFDQETESYYNYHRSYDPSLGRYLESDPIGMKGGSNNYHYVQQNPLVFADPSGLRKWNDDDYFDHYNNGGGAAVDIGATGLLYDFRNSHQIIESVQNAKDDYRSELRSRLFKKCKKCTTYVFDTFWAHESEDNYNFKWFFGRTVLILGKGTLFNQGYCYGRANCKTGSWNGHCNLHFYVRDKFKDPWDYWDWFSGETETGTPYALRGDWQETASWSE